MKTLVIVSCGLLINFSVFAKSACENSQTDSLFSLPMSAQVWLVNVFYPDNCDLLDFLLSGGVSISEQYPGVKFKDGVMVDINKCPHWDILALACHGNATNCLAKIIEYYPDVINKRDGTSLLHAVAKLLNEDMAIKLAEIVLASTDVDVDICKSPDGPTPLLMALFWNRARYANWLISRGAKFDKNKIRRKSKYKEATCLVLAADYDFEAFCVVLDYCFANGMTKDEMNSLMLNIKPNDSSYERKIRKLIKLGANINYQHRGDSVVNNLISSSANLDKCEFKKKIDFLKESGIIPEKLKILNEYALKQYAESN